MSLYWPAPEEATKVELPKPTLVAKKVLTPTVKLGVKHGCKYALADLNRTFRDTDRSWKQHRGVQYR